jgi:L-ascorbate metabolism protein UlaG (beta-lactamase superfamily)
MMITWYGTASLKIESQNCAVMLDPYITRNSTLPPMKPADLNNVNAVLLTHGHFDHASDLPSLVNDCPIPVYASAETVKVLAKKERYMSLDLNPVIYGTKFEAGDFIITPYKAEHVKFDILLILRTIFRILKNPFSTANSLAGVVSDFFKYPEGETFAWELQTGSRSVLVFGSMGFSDDVNYPSPDLLILPLQGHSRIFDLAVEAAARIKPAAVMPDHFDDSFPPVSGTIDAHAFSEFLEERIPHIKSIIPRHGEKIKLS